MSFKNSTVKFPVKNYCDQEMILVIEPLAHVYRIQSQQSLEIQVKIVNDELIAFPLELLQMELHSKMILLHETDNLELEIFRDGVKVEPFADGFPGDFKEIYGITS
jgi:hypothetical protein